MRCTINWLKVAVAASALLVACEKPLQVTGPTSGAVVQLVLQPATISIPQGSGQQFAAYGRRSNGDSVSVSVTYTATGGSIAPSGYFTAGQAVGAFRVKAKQVGGALEDSSAVAVTAIPVATVAVSPASATVAAGQTAQIVAATRDASGNLLPGRVVTWASSNTAIATVNGSGLVTGVAAGTATITATSEGQSGTAAVTVTTVPVASVAVSPATLSVAVGQTGQLAATPKDASGNALTGRVVTWASSNTAIATVNGSGLVMGVAAGTATITATSEGQSGTAAVTVTAAITNPGTVTDLAVAGVTDSSVTLAFTEVNDGSAKPASYDIRWAAGTLSWTSATDVTRGTCATPLTGTAIGAKRSCTVLGLAAGTAYQFQAVAFRGTLNVNAVFGGLSNVASGTTTASAAPVASVSVSPASASVAVGGVQQFSATLKDAASNVLTGRTITWSSSTPSVATVSGSGLGTGLVVGTATITATSGGVTGTATLTVTVAPPGGVVFQSDWSTGTGTAANIVTDGGRWANYWEFNGGTSVQLLSVVSGVGAPGGRNALKVLQRGSTYAANLQQGPVSVGGANVSPPIVPVSTDYYVRFYMRNDDTSPSGDHIVTVDTWQYPNLEYMRKSGGSTGWTFVIGMYGCGYTYPIGYWHPAVTLSLGAWYRFEYFVHFVDATHVQVHPRLYDAAGTLLYDDATYQQSDPGAASWNGSSNWTLASYYAAGYNFCVNPTYLTSFGLGNNGQQGATDTGLAWYYAGVQIRTDTWPGP